MEWIGNDTHICHGQIVPDNRGTNMACKMDILAESTVLSQGSILFDETGLPFPKHDQLGRGYMLDDLPKSPDEVVHAPTSIEIAPIENNEAIWING